MTQPFGEANWPSFFGLGKEERFNSTNAFGIPHLICKWMLFARDRSSKGRMSSRPLSRQKRMIDE
jgi:hypothetical protein